MRLCELLIACGCGVIFTLACVCVGGWMARRAHLGQTMLPLPPARPARFDPSVVLRPTDGTEPKREEKQRLRV